jgi:hypothetical protein
MQYYHHGILLFSLVITTFIYFIPLNFWLSLGSLKMAINLSLWNLIVTLPLWVLYQWLFNKALENSKGSWFISFIVLVGFVFLYLLARFIEVYKNKLPEDRVLGWILFSSVMNIGVLISVPLIASLMLWLVHH